MKTYSMICFFLALAMILCPLLSVEKAKDVFSGEFLSGERVEAEKAASSEIASSVKIMSADSKNITELSLEEYLLGVVAEEMSATYEEEAIKAQIIASHTLLQFTKNKGGADGADITDNSATHQGYLTPEEQKEKWGENYDKYREKILKCIDEVKWLLIYHNNEPITAVFHSISNGRTENATDVWGGEYPYLTSVTSDYDKLSPYYSNSVAISKEEFCDKLDVDDIVIGEITRTNTGMVKEIIINDTVYKGTDIRTVFSLRSATFDLEYKDESYIFTVRGYGHGVGMSQNGANYMAQQGFSYKEILEHYYPNTEIK